MVAVVVEDGWPVVVSVVIGPPESANTLRGEGRKMMVRDR